MMPQEYGDRVPDERFCQWIQMSYSVFVHCAHGTHITRIGLLDALFRDGVVLWYGRMLCDVS